MTAACIFTGLLAGGDADRYIVQEPAWRHVNILNWLEYSRHADLGNGLIFYPFEAITGFILLLASSAIIVIYKDAFKYPAFIAHMATLLSATGLILTFFAAPIMLSLRTMENNPVLVQDAFDRFHFIGYLRAIVQVLSFCACTWALRKLFATSIAPNIKK